MATDYKVADGNNNVAGYATLTVQPLGGVVKYPEQRRTLNGQIVNAGLPYISLRWAILQEDEFNAVIVTQVGVSPSVPSNVITLCAPGLDDRDPFDDWNGTANLVNHDFYDRCYHDVQVDVVGMTTV